MTLSNPPHEMFKLTSFLHKIVINPYFGVFLSMVLILPSLYVILEDLSVFRIQYVFVAVGIPVYIKSLMKIFKDILNSK